MSGYILRRLLAMIPVLLVVALVVFALIHIAPGDPAALIVGTHATEEKYELIRESLGLNKPMYVQLGIWFGNLFQGDLGESLFGKTSVTKMIGQRIVPTFSVAAFTLIFSMAIAIPLGIIAAWKANSWIDRSVMIFTTLGYSVPLFWLGFILMWAFAVKLNWFPAIGYTAPTENVGKYFYHMVLPVLATGLVVMALIGRMTRATMLEVLSEDYIRTARSKGLAETRVLLAHALRNAMLPIITVCGISLALLLGGVVVTENVFAIPGMGRLLVNALSHRDYPVIQGTVLVFAAIVAFINLLIDPSYGLLDPRIRYK